MLGALFTLGDWSIWDNTADEGFEFYAKHECDIEVYKKARKGQDHDTDGEPGNYSWFSSDDPCTCYYCEVAVPDEIQGLVLLLIAGFRGGL